MSFKKTPSAADTPMTPAALKARPIRRRQDLHDVPANQRKMHDHTAHDLYQQIWIGGLRDDKDPNLSEEEEEYPGYEAPTVNHQQGLKIMERERERIARIHADRQARLKRIRADKNHTKDKTAFQQLLAESEAYYGTGDGASSSGPKRRGGAGNGDDEEDDPDNPHCFIAASPSYLKGQLRPYQVEGVNWLLGLFNRNVNGILADEMGLGKTFQTIATISYLRFTYGMPGPHLVIVPKSVLGNWLREFKKWSPALKVFKFHGSADVRPEMIRTHLRADAIRYDVILTTFDMILYEKTAFQRIHWNYMIIDEAHKLKNNESSAHQVIDKLRSDHRLLITGTPLQNDLSELWALLHFLSPDLFDRADSFEQWFNASAGEEDSVAVSSMHLILNPLMIRRLKQDVNTGIPPKREIYVSCKMSTRQRNWYLTTITRDASDLNRASGGAITTLNNIVMQLRKVCNHPYLMPGGWEGPPYLVNDAIIRSSGKMVLLDKLLAKLFNDKEGKHKVLLFAQMTKMLDIIEDYLVFRGYKFCRIDGDTTGMDRDRQMASFNNPNSEEFIFLLSTRAGGLGINLQAANHVILYDSDWNPQMDLQAQDRAHRIGQKRSVRIYRFITDNSVEERIYKRALKKLYLDAMVVQQGRINQAARTSAGKVSKEELMSMVKFGCEEIFKSRKEDVTDEDIDALLAQGETAMEALQKDTKSSTQASLASFKLGADESSLYDFEGINYQKASFGQNVESKMLHITLDEPISREDLYARAVKFGEVLKVVIHPNLKEALVSFRTQPGATDAMKNIGLTCAFANRKSENVVTAEMIEECYMLPGEERLGRGHRTVHLAADQATANSAPPESAQQRLERQAIKLPKKPVFPTHQLFDVQRLNHLYDMECEVITRNWRRRNRAAADELEFVEEKLSAAEVDERERLMAEGFDQWTLAEFNALIACLTSGEVGTGNYAKISEWIGTKSEGEVKDYLSAFFERGPALHPRFDAYKQRIDKAAGKVAAKKDFETAMRWKVEGCENPKELKFAFKSKEPELDRELFLAYYDGGFNVDVGHQVKALPRYQFDIWMRTRSGYFFEQRLRSLTNSVKREWDKAHGRSVTAGAAEDVAEGEAGADADADESDSKRRRAEADSANETPAPEDAASSAANAVTSATESASAADAADAPQ